MSEVRIDDGLISMFRSVPLDWFQIEALLDNEDVGKDVSSVEDLIRKLDRIEADVVAHEEVLKSLDQNGEELMKKREASDAIDAGLVEERRLAVNEK